MTGRQKGKLRQDSRHVLDNDGRPPSLGGVKAGVLQLEVDNRDLISPASGPVPELPAANPKRALRDKPAAPMWLRHYLERALE